MPNYAALAAQGIYCRCGDRHPRLRRASARETFYIDLGAMFDTLELCAAICRC